MRLMNKNLLIAIFLFLSPCPSNSDTIDIQLTFDPQDVILNTEIGYDTVDYPETIQMMDLGKPSLPMTSVYVSLPFNSTVSSVSVVSSQTQVISGNFFIYPVQLPQIIGEYTTEAGFTLPDPSVYNEDVFYPDIPYSDPFIGNFVGATMGVVVVYPFRYNPVYRELQIYTSLTLRLTYTPPSPPPEPERYMEDRNRDLIIENVKSIVDNPNDVENNYEPVNLFSLSDSPPLGYSLDAPNPLDMTSIPSDMTYPYTYLIITNDKYCGFDPTEETDGIIAECSPLKSWRTELGVPATLRTVQWIETNYWTEPTEYDLQTAIRNFLADAHEYWGTQWLIIIGDVNTKLTAPYYNLTYIYTDGYEAIVPARFLCPTNNPDDPEDTWFYSPCDLYYMNVTDDFNSDGDEYYGEYEDIHDGSFSYSINIFGARVPADTETEVESFIDKLLHYEKLDFNLPDSGTYLSRCLQVASDFAIFDDNLAVDLGEAYLSQIFDIENIIEGKEGMLPNPDIEYPDYPEPWQVVEAMNNPAGIINIATHGHPRGYYILTHGDYYPPKGPIYIQFLSSGHEYPCKYVHGWNFDKALDDVDIDPKYSLMYSNSCKIHLYDDGFTGVVGEEFLFNPSWGGSIAVGNTRVGLVDSSFYIMQDFYGFLMNKTSDYGDDMCYSGYVQCNTLKENWEFGHFSLTYVNQLFGCPRTAIWRGDPQKFDVSTEVLGNPGDYTLRVTVLNDSDQQPVFEAVVCLWKRDNPPYKYYVDLTNPNGVVNFSVGSGFSNAILTVSYEQYNYIPDQTNVSVP